MISSHEAFIQRCIDLANLAGNSVHKNPNVGAVLVHNNQIIGEGYYAEYGGSHAEVNAFNNVANKDIHRIKEATLYVSLEPCCIHSKTPPCTDKIISEGVKKVVIATTDPNNAMNGKSISLLESKGVEVITDIMADESQKLIAPFNATLNGRPYVILKWAQSADGYIAIKNEQSKISNTYTNVLTHMWRKEVDGIVVGHNTVLIDNPKLDVRHVNYDGNQPIPIILSNDPILLKNAYVFNRSIDAYTYKNDNIENMLADLSKKGITRILVEGGAKTHQSFIDKGLWDEARIIRSAIKLGKGIRSARIHAKLSKSQKVASDTIDFLYR